MVSGPSLPANLQAAEGLLRQAADGGAELAVLPEYFCLMGHDDSDKIAVREVFGSGAVQDWLARTARALGLWIVGGTLPLAAGDEAHVRNTSLVYAPDGSCRARYDKIHLFKFDNGRECYDEGSAIRAGAAPTTVQAGELKVGLSVCYDLRFPELYRGLMHPPCDLITVPAAFTYTTGLAHWELLLRARAVENQCYVAAAAQGGTHENGRRTYGHSMIVDPWGKVLDLLAEGEGVVFADVDAAHIAAVRTQLPALEHRRV
jgi:nitrilase